MSEWQDYLERLHTGSLNEDLELTIEVGPGWAGPSRREGVGAGSRQAGWGGRAHAWRTRLGSQRPGEGWGREGGGRHERGAREAWQLTLPRPLASHHLTSLIG